MPTSGRHRFTAFHQSKAGKLVQILEVDAAVAVAPSEGGGHREVTADDVVLGGPDRRGGSVRSGLHQALEPGALFDVRLTLAVGSDSSDHAMVPSNTTRARHSVVPMNL